MYQRDLTSCCTTHAVGWVNHDQDRLSRGSYWTERSSLPKYDFILPVYSLLLNKIYYSARHGWNALVTSWGEKYVAAKFYVHIHSHISVPKVFH
jgi:hypothetical protein